MTDIACRWSPRTIRKNLTKLHRLMARLDVRVECGDFQIAIDWLADRAPRSTLGYFDPPYVAKGGACYVHAFDTADHDRLARGVLELRCHRRVSYDGVARALYPTATIHELSQGNSMASHRTADTVAVGPSAEILISLDAALGRHGGDRRSGRFKVANATLKPRKRDAAWWLARLRRDRPDLAMQVDAGEVSTFAACVAAGWRKAVQS